MDSERANIEAFSSAAGLAATDAADETLDVRSTEAAEHHAQTLVQTVSENSSAPRSNELEVEQVRQEDSASIVPSTVVWEDGMLVWLLFSSAWLVAVDSFGFYRTSESTCSFRRTALVCTKYIQALQPNPVRT